MTKLPNWQQNGHGLLFVRPDLKKILRRCQAPKHWGDTEIDILLNAAFNPQSLIATNEAPPGLREPAIQFARLYGTAPLAVIKVLPKFRARVERAFQTPHQVVMMEALRQAMFGIDSEFWTAKSDDVAQVIGKYRGLKIKGKHVEHARDLLRKQFPQKPN